MKMFQIVEVSTGVVIADLRLESDDSPQIISDTYRIDRVLDGDLTLDELKGHYISQIDLFAGEVRARFMSRGYGQEITYVEKRLDALNYIAAGSPSDASGFPFVSAEATSTGQAPSTVAAMIIGRSDALRALGSVIEAQRVRGGDQVAAAADEASAKAAMDFAIASLDSHRAT